ncbi:MAG: murein L,D-transpeptidase [Chloroflexi bacterium]|nr:MAG: murein L,D-transpeptidase [Chloroflexota bacterium]
MVSRRLLLLQVLLAISLFANPNSTLALDDNVRNSDHCPQREIRRYLFECYEESLESEGESKGNSGENSDPMPLQTSSPDPELGFLPYNYRRVNRENAPLFLSLEEAIAGEPVYRYLESGFDFISFIEIAKVDGKTFYMIAPGVWMQGTGLSPIAITDFQGIEFTSSPTTPFGWALFPLESQKQPKKSELDPVAYDFFRYDLVQILDIRDVNGTDWYLVGPDQWLEGKQVAMVSPQSVPEGVSNGRWIDVNLEQQTIAVYDNHHLIFASIISSGLPGTWTQPGLFQIYLMKETETMSGSFTADRSDYYYLEDVPWTMYFDEARALHGTYWHNGFGVPRSRGCANLSPGDAQWIFNWAQEGDWVHVWDPSGQTPTDPTLYGSGGA